MGEHGRAVEDAQPLEIYHRGDAGRFPALRERAQAVDERAQLAAPRAQELQLALCLGRVDGQRQPAPARHVGRGTEQLRRDRVGSVRRDAGAEQLVGLHAVEPLLERPQGLGRALRPQT